MSDSGTDRMNAGAFGAFSWLESATSLPLIDTALPFHLGARLCVTAFDSGPLRLTPEEVAAGWSSVGEIVVSPLIVTSPEVPSGGYDEWYILESSPPASWKPEVFVNYGGFRLAHTRNSRVPGDDFHGQMVTRFWRQIEELRPLSYLASGDFDIVVSRSRPFIERLSAALSPRAAAE